MRCMGLSSFALTFAVLGAVAGGCGGKVDDPSPTLTTGTRTPGSTNAPTNATTSGAGCEAACDHQHDCTSPPDDRDACLRSCVRDFTDPSQARLYGMCVASISCSSIQANLSMDWGPLGECWSMAHER